jgi:hypothetical protein
MLGKYGETFVVDWGLGKVIKSDDPEETADADFGAQAGNEDSSMQDQTDTGIAMGTYAYMPPEQALIKRLPATWRREKRKKTRNSWLFRDV